MQRITAFLFLCFISIHHLQAQILPKEGRALNYRIIGFSFPPVTNNSEYIFELAIGSHNSEESFKKNIINTYICKASRKIVEVPFWGQEYTWRIRSANEGPGAISSFHHFSTLFKNKTDSCKVRLRIMQEAKKYKEGYVFLDANKALYNMKGEAVWFLPGKTFLHVSVRDMKATPFGTITLMLKDEEKVYEINYEGDILWQGPNTGAVSGNATEHYHHEFTRLANGHYMALGNEMFWESPKHRDSSAADTNLYHSTEPMPTIIEYDENGKLVWSWLSSGYFRTSDLINFNTKFFVQKVPVDVDVHANSFYFDEKAKVIYLSFKGISRIVKVKYPEGVVLNTYGAVFHRGVPEQRNGLFCEQHSIKHSPNGYIYMYNNNPCETGHSAKLIEMEEPASGKTELKKIWEYECTVEGNYSKESLASGGGNVMELPDSSLFVSMGGAYSKVFIVSHSKDILWSAIPEKWLPAQQKWSVVPQYRASIIEDRKVLEKLIWTAEKHK